MLVLVVGKRCWYVVLYRVGVCGFGVMTHVLVGDSAGVFLPSYKLLMIHGFLFCGTRFVAA